MCDTMAAAGSVTASGAVLFAKNSDREFTEAQFLQMLPAARHEAGAKVRLTHVEIDQARETYAVLLSKPHWIWGAEIGTNEHGLTIGNEALLAKIEPPAGPGVIGMDYLRLALERARDGNEAIAVITSLLREHGQGGNCGFRRQITYHNSFIIADPRGVKVLETVDREWVVKSVPEYWAISNCMSIESEFDSSSPTLRALASEAKLYAQGAAFGFKSVFEDASRSISGNYRRARAAELMAARAGRLEPADLFRVLRDHQEREITPGRPGARICAHTRENPLGQTTAGWVAQLAPGKTVHWVTGTAAPCTGLFKPVLMETGLPEHGPAPGAEEDGASLWWRHEQLRRGLDDADQRTRDGFTAERNSLEVRFLRDVEACRGVDDPSGRAELKRVVDACWHDGLAFEARWLATLRHPQAPGGSRT